MKVSKLIVPMVALTAVNTNNNNQVMVANAVEYTESASSADCGYILQKLAECWQMPNPFAAAACSAFWAAAAAANCV